jgi:hypothetical protein
MKEFNTELKIGIIGVNKKCVQIKKEEHLYKAER